MLKDFAQDRRAVSAMFAAFTVSILGGAAAIAVDAGMVHLAKLEMQQASDLAALSAVSQLPDQQAAIQTAVEIANLNLGDAKFGKQITAENIVLGQWNSETQTFVSSTANANAIRVVADRSVAGGNEIQFVFARLFGQEFAEIDVAATAALNARQLEMALVLDVSGSMNEKLTTPTSPPDDDGTDYALCASGGGDDDDDDDINYWTSGCSAGSWQPNPSVQEKKIEALRRVATDLIDTIAEVDPTMSSTRIAIMPFSGRVNISKHGSSWMASMGYGDSLRLCTGRRFGEADIDDTSPTIENFPPFSLNSYSCPVPQAIGLTDSLVELRDTIASLTAGGTTNTDVGMAWGWRALSPNWQGHWGQADRPLERNSAILDKMIVIMTDGENTPHQTGDSYSTAEADDRLRWECEAMKAEGYTIITITFDAPTSIEALYQECASKPSFWFSPRNISQLEDAFREIGDVAAQRIALVE